MSRNLNCDLCNKPLKSSEVVRIPLREMQEAVRAGFNPFKTPGIDFPKIHLAAGLSDELHYLLWQQMVMNDTTDWGLCPSCAKAFRNERALSVGQLTSAETMQTSTSTKNDECFIATAAYGSPLASEVILLRKFRDERLNHNEAGRFFVRLYERFSPPLADWIATHSTRRKLTQRFVLSPVVWLLKHYMQLK